MKYNKLRKVLSYWRFHFQTTAICSMLRYQILYLQYFEKKCIFAKSHIKYR